MRERASVARFIRRGAGTKIIKAEGLNDDLPISRDSEGRQIPDFDFPGAGAHAHAGEDTDLAVAAERRENGEDAVCGSFGGKTCAGHALGVVLVHVPCAVCKVWRVGVVSPHKLCESVVQLTVKELVCAQAGCVVTLEASNVPCCGGILTLIVAL